MWEWSRYLKVMNFRQSHTITQFKTGLVEKNLFHNQKPV